MESNLYQYLLEQQVVPYLRHVTLGDTQNSLCSEGKEEGAEATASLELSVVTLLRVFGVGDVWQTLLKWTRVENRTDATDPLVAVLFTRLEHLCQKQSTMPLPFRQIGFVALFLMFQHATHQPGQPRDALPVPSALLEQIRTIVLYRTVFPALRWKSGVAAVYLRLTALIVLTQCFTWITSSQQSGHWTWWHNTWESHHHHLISSTDSTTASEESPSVLATIFSLLDDELPQSRLLSLCLMSQLLTWEMNFTPPRSLLLGTRTEANSNINIEKEKHLLDCCLKRLNDDDENVRVTAVNVIHQVILLHEKYDSLAFSASQDVWISCWKGTVEKIVIYLDDPNPNLQNTISSLLAYLMKTIHTVVIPILHTAKIHNQNKKPIELLL
jgi:hypothetical protein